MWGAGGAAVVAAVVRVAIFSVAVAAGIPVSGLVFGIWGWGGTATVGFGRGIGVRVGAVVTRVASCAFPGFGFSLAVPGCGLLVGFVCVCGVGESC